MDDVLQRDQNHVTVIGGVTDDIHQYIRPLLTDPSSGRLLVSAVVAGTSNGKLRVSGSDILYDYLSAKMDSSDGSIQYTIDNPGGDEILDLTVDASNISVGEVSLKNGGTGTNLSAPLTPSLFGWDTTSATAAFFALGTGLTYDHSTHTLNASTSNFYQTVELNASPLPQELKLNFSTLFTATDNSLNTSTDIDINASALASDSTFITDITNNSTFLNNIANSSTFVNDLIANNTFTTNLALNTNFTTELSSNNTFVNDLTSNSNFVSNITTIVTTGGGLPLETNGMPNGNQGLLNLVEGTNITIFDDGSGNITFSATGIGTGTVTSVATSGSLTGGTITTSGTLSLINDSATPGNSRYYGTNSSGTKGFFPLPGATGINYTVNADENQSGWMSTQIILQQANSGNLITAFGNGIHVQDNTGGGVSSSRTLMSIATGIQLTFANTKIIRLKIPGNIGSTSGGTGGNDFGYTDSPGWSNKTFTGQKRIMFFQDASGMYTLTSDGSTTPTINSISPGSIYEIVWTPGTNVVFLVDGSIVATHTTGIPTTGNVSFDAASLAGGGTVVGPAIMFPTMSVQV